MTTSSMNIRRLIGAEEPEWIVWVLVIVLLGAGLALRGSVEGRTQQFTGGGITVSYPADWVDNADGSVLLNAGATFSGRAPTSVQVRQVAVTAIGQKLKTMSDIALAWSAGHNKEFDAYSALRVEPTTLGGKDAVLIEYAYVAPPLVGAASTGVPVIARARDYLVRQGDTVTVLTLVAEANTFTTADALWEAIIASVRF